MLSILTSAKWSSEYDSKIFLDGKYCKKLKEGKLDNK